LERKDIRRIAVRTVFYALIVVSVIWVTRYQQFDLTALTGRPFTTYDLGFMATPLLVMITMVYAAAIIQKLLKGRLIKPIATSLQLLSVPSLLMLLSSWEGMPEPIVPTINVFFQCVLAYVVYSLVNVVLETYEKIARPVSRSLLLVVTGYILTNAVTKMRPYISGFDPGIFGKANTIILYSFVATAALSLFEVAKHSSNEVVSFTSRLLSRSLPTKFVSMACLFLYLFLVRGFLIGQYAFLSTYIVVFEWIAICLFAYSTYRSFRGYVEKEFVVPDIVEEWRQHIQSIDWVTDHKLEDVANSVKLFVEKGVKDMLVIYLVSIMSRVSVSEGLMANAISPLLAYVDLKPGLVILSWQVSYIESENRARRKSILKKVLDNLDSLSVTSKVILEDSRMVEEKVV
jgi:hypothetical protein